MTQKPQKATPPWWQQATLLSWRRTWQYTVPVPEHNSFYFSGRVLGVALEWKLADLWVGLFWKREHGGWWHVWVCLLPCLPIHVYWRV